MRNVIVTGSGRGGTSLVAGTLAGAGYHMGASLVEPRDANPKGFFESRSINAINEMILADAVPYRADDADEPAHVPQRRQYWLANVPPGSPLRDGPDITAQIDAAIARVPYCYKDPRFCYTLPVWQPRLVDACCVCVFRHPAATVASILKEAATAPYLATLRIDTNGAMALWQTMHRRVLDELRHTGDWLFIHADQMLSDRGLDRLTAFTGAAIDRSFPERGLQRSASDGPVPAAVASTYRELCELAACDGAAS